MPVAPTFVYVIAVTAVPVGSGVSVPSAVLPRSLAGQSAGKVIAVSPSPPVPASPGGAVVPGDPSPSGLVVASLPLPAAPIEVSAPPPIDASPLLASAGPACEPAHMARPRRGASPRYVAARRPSIARAHA